MAASNWQPNQIAGKAMIHQGADFGHFQAAKPMMSARTINRYAPKISSGKMTGLPNFTSPNANQAPHNPAQISARAGGLVASFVVCIGYARESFASAMNSENLAVLIKPQRRLAFTVSV